MTPADDQYGDKVITVPPVGHQTPPPPSGGLPNTGLVLYPVVIVALALVLVGVILRIRSN